MSIEISVMIPCYKQAHFLPGALDSVRQSRTDRAFEIIVVDDASPDDVIGVCGSEVIYVWTRENLGVAGARNLGIGYARGQKIVTLDADDTLLPNALEAWAQTLDDNPDAFLTYGDIEFFGNRDGIWRLPPPTWEVLQRKPGIPSVVMQRKEAWERIKRANGHGYDPGQPYGWEDFLYYREMYCLGMKAIKLNVVCARYRQHDDSRSVLANAHIAEIRAYQWEKIHRLYGQIVC